MKAVCGFIVIGLALSNPASGASATRRPVNLRCCEPDTHQALFTANDIVRFDWDKQLFELRRDAAATNHSCAVVSHRR